MPRPRNRSNEILVAIVVVAVLAVALTFGIILSVSTTADDDDDAPAATTTAIAGDVRDTLPPQATTSPTPAPSDTATLPPPSDTATRAPTTPPTQVAAVASDTPSPEPSRTPRPSNTPSPEPTRTPRPSSTPSPEPTRTPRPSDTPTVEPTITLTPSATRIQPTLTFTPYPTLTPSITPFSGGQTSSRGTPAANVCLPPPDWIPYTIQQGDTLFGLTLRINQTLPANEQISLETLSAANCIRDPGKITAGETIYVPAGTSIAAPVATLPNGSAATPSGPLSFNCGNPAFTITEPRPGTVLRGTFAIYGTATHPDFQFYRLQVSSGSAQDDDFATLDVFREPVINGQLGIVDTAAFGPGDYWLRLTVVDNTGNYPPQCTIRVSFE